MGVSFRAELDYYFKNVITAKYVLETCTSSPREAYDNDYFCLFVLRRFPALQVTDLVLQVKDLVRPGVIVVDTIETFRFEAEYGYEDPIKL